MSDARNDPAFGRAGDDSEQIQSHLGSREEEKKRLQDELAGFLSQAEEELDSDRLDALLAALEEIDPMPEIPDAGESLKRFHEQNASLFPAEEPSAEADETSPEKKCSRFTVFKTAVVAAIFVFALGSIAAQAFGVNVFGTVARWSSERFQFQSEEIPYATIRFDPLEEDEEASYDTLEEAIDAFGITAPIAPTWVPERFVLTGVTAVKQAGGLLICADYECDDGVFQIRYSETTDLDLNGLEKEDGYMELYIRGKINHYLMNDMERWKAYWQNGEVECLMAGTVSKQEIKDIIDSIY